jgi:glucose-1-phosphate adenylyltransferase
MDVGTIESFWMTNMDLVKTLPDFNLYDDFWNIYTDTDHQSPLFTGPGADVKTSLLSEGCEVYGNVYNSVLGPDVIVEEGAVVRDSIIMERTRIGRNARLERCIVDSHCEIGENAVIGEGENVPNALKPKVYDTGITVLGEYSFIPDNVSVGKNCVVYGRSAESDYPGGRLESGGSILIEPETDEEAPK